MVLQNDDYPYYRLNLRKETNGIQSISLDARNGPSRLWLVAGHFYPVGPSRVLFLQWATKHSYYKVVIAAVVAVYNLGFTSMIRDLHCTEFQATIGLSVFTLGFGVVPLVTSSFSEEFGRLPLYIVSGIGFFLMFPMIALYVRLHYSMVIATHLHFFFIRAKNIQTVIVARFLQGAFGSTAATMVGGTIADIWLTKE